MPPSWIDVAGGLTTALAPPLAGRATSYFESASGKSPTVDLEIDDQAPRWILLLSSSSSLLHHAHTPLAHIPLAHPTQSIISLRSARRREP